MMETDLKVAVYTLSIILAVVILFYLVTTSEPISCPRYGHVPVMINSEVECIPWEEVK